MQKVKKKTYKNGLRVLVVPMMSNLTASVMVLTNTGSNYENKDNNGISHFLEHSVFKGTGKRTNSKILHKEFDSLGCDYNAFTTNELTAYYAKGDSKKVPKFLSLIGDIYQNPIFPKEDIEKEKGVIIEEISMYEDMPKRQVDNLFDELLYGDQPSGWSIAGSKDNVRKITRDSLIRYKENNYVAEKTLVVVAGNIDEKKIFKEIEKNFKNISKNRGLEEKRTLEKQTKPEIKVKIRNSDQTHLILGVRAFSISDKRNVVVSVIANILGFGMGSRLFSKIRDDLGLAYYIYATNDSFKDHGYLAIKSGVNNNKLSEAIKAIIKECQKLTKEDITKEELDRVKTVMISQLKMSLESSSGVALFFGAEEIMTGKYKTVEESIGEIKGVTPSDIKRISKQIFINKNLNLALVGPIKEEKKIIKYLNFN